MTTVEAPILPFHAEDRVAFGARFMDENWPKWTEAIDLGNLDMMMGRHCIGAQLMQSVSGRPRCFWDFRAHLFNLLDLDDALSAFMMAGGWFAGNDLLADDEREYAALQTAWTREILARRNG